MPTRTLARTDAVKSPNGRVDVSANVLRPRRKPVHIVAGALLVVVLSAAFMWTQLRSDQAVQVLAVARAVPAGQVIAAADLRLATVVPDPSVALIASAQAQNVVGRTAAVPLVAGTLLSPDQVGPAAWPAPGEAVVALPLKPGRMPAGITPGARVQMLVLATGTATDTGTAGSGPSGPTATVVDVANGVDASGTVVVSLLMRSGDAAEVAAAGGEATLVLLGPAG